MKKLATLLLLLLLLPACVSTTVQDTWKDPSYHRRPASTVLVVGLPAGSATGTACMNEFVAQLRKEGVSATTGYSGAPASYTRESAIAKARESGAQSVLVCRFLKKETQLDVYPRQNNGMLISRDIEIWSPNEYVQNEYQVFGTILYDAATGKTVWSAVSDTYAGASQPRVMKSYVGAMIDEMKGANLLATR